MTAVPAGAAGEGRETLWRCATCGKWSHAKRRPHGHERFIRATRAEGEQPPPNVLRADAEFAGFGEEDSYHLGGWVVRCGPFVEYRAELVERTS